MPFNVNTNMSSMQAQLNTGKTESSIGKSIQRLSSGLRVNGAADDAAGLAIAKNMSKQVSGYEVNVRNANDAVSLLQVAEGGMDEIGNMLQRMKDLALQSANGTNSTAQRNNMDLEFQQLISEIDRVVDTTQFNGLNLLDGTQIQNTNFQVDEGSTSTVDTIQVSIGDVQSSGLSGGVGTTLFAGVTASDTFSGNDTITITADPNDSGDISLAYNVTDGTTASALVDMINAESDQHLLSAAIQNGNLVIYQNNTTAASTDSTIALTTGETLGGQAITAAFSIAAGGGTQSLNSTSISTEANANIAIDVLDGAITKITTERATIGASQNRFDKAINNLNNKIVSVSAAMGRIMDADFAKETAEFSKSQILQQAGVSMMAQAKALPNQLLSLLQ